MEGVSAPRVDRWCPARADGVVSAPVDSLKDRARPASSRESGRWESNPAFLTWEALEGVSGCIYVSLYVSQKAIGCRLRESYGKVGDECVAPRSGRARIVTPRPS